jgi:Zn-dependent peptidase ImmA (M78 family)/DNA-binding XRE family transcriptional regulator
MSRNGVSICAERLTLAREFRGFSIADLAKSIGKSRQHVAAVENGSVRPGLDVLYAISSALEFPVRFLTKPEPLPVLSGTIHYRSMKAALASQRKQSEAWLKLLANEYAFLESAVNFPPVKLYSFTGNDEELLDEELLDDDIDGIAAEVRKFWGLGNGPINNVTLLLENNGFIIAHSEVNTPFLDSCSTVWHGRPFIWINTTRRTCSRVLADLAHELGHLVLHGGVDHNELQDPSRYKQIEDQAWRFARSFLMPASSLSGEVLSASIYALEKLKPRWRTSIALMIMQCHSVGIIDEYRKEHLFRELSRKGYRRKEPLDDTLAIEKPRLMLDAVNILIDAGAYTKKQILELSALPQALLSAIVGSEAEYFDQTPQRPQLYLLK